MTAGDVIAEIQTDKSAVGYEVQEDGYIAKILASAGGDSIECGKPICVVTGKKDNIAAFSTFTGTESVAQAAPSNAAPAQNNTSSTNSNPVAAPQQNGPRAQDDRIIATPYAKVIAKEKKVDLKSVQGSGPNGRIKADDVLNFKPSAQTQSKTQQTSQTAPAPGQAFADKPLSQMRKVIAQRLTESKQNVPHYYVTMEILMDKLLK